MGLTRCPPAAEEFVHGIVASSPDRIRVLDLSGSLLSVDEPGNRRLGVADRSALLRTH